MKKYYVHRFYKTPISLSQDRQSQQGEELSAWSFNFPVDKVSVCIKDEVREVDAKKFHFGLTVVAEVFANNDEDATSVSMMYSEALMNMLVLSTLSVCSAPKMISIIGFNKFKDLTFKNNVYSFCSDEAILKIIPIEIEKFDQIYKGCNRIVNSERAMRAMSWLRKGINEKNSVDKFISFWVGLEVLKGIFPKDDKIEERGILEKIKIILSEMSYRRRTGVKNKDEWKAVESIFIDKLKRNDFKKIKQARSAILHGFGELSPKFHRQVDEYWNVVKNGLIWSLGIIIGLDSSFIENVITNEKKSYLGIRYVVGGKIEGLSGELKDDFKNFPRIDLTKNDVQGAANEKGDISLKLKTTFKTHGATDKVKWKVDYTEVWGE